MFYMILAVIFNTFFTLGMKVTQIKKLNTSHSVFINYLAGFIISLAICLVQRSFSVLPAGGTGRGGLPFIMLVTLACGFVVAVCYVGGAVLSSASLRYNGAALTSLFGKIGFLLAIVIGIVVWHEIPSALQVLGIVIALAAIVLLNIKNVVQRDQGVARRSILLPLMILIGGACDTARKVFNQDVGISFNTLFMLATFAFAVIMCTWFVVSENKKSGDRRFKLPEIVIGVIMGAANYGYTFFFSRGIAVLPMAVAVTMSAIGSVLLMSIIGWTVFKERIKAKDLVAMLMIFASILLINL